MDQRARIREEIDEARMSLADKLQIIDERARQGFTDARKKARESLNVRHQAKQHPFVVAGLALGAGVTALGVGLAARRFIRGGRLRPATHRTGGMTFHLGGERGVRPPEPWLTEPRRPRIYRGRYAY